MSIFDSATQITNEFSGGGNHAAVAGALMEQLGGPGGITGLIQTFHQKGAGGLIQQFANGQVQGVDPATIEKVVGGSGLIDTIAQKTGVSADTVRSSLATIIPVLVNHVTTNGHVTTEGQPAGNPLPDSETLVKSILGKLL